MAKATLVNFPPYAGPVNVYVGRDGGIKVTCGVELEYRVAMYFSPSEALELAQALTNAAMAGAK